MTLVPETGHALSNQGEMPNPVQRRQLKHPVNSKPAAGRMKCTVKVRMLSKGRPPGMTQCSKSQIPISVSRGTVNYITRMANLIIPLHKDRTYPVLTNGPRPTTLGTLQGHGNKTINKSKSWFREFTFQKWESTVK